MITFNLNREWEFITKETHSKKDRKNLLKREVLFVLQILLCRLEKGNYFILKRIYNNLQTKKPL
ncbi:hypothetical protein HYW73_01265 [Candidatus Nomurabacteria bacterium]|nr:hypothetical protein [Candidatus Nomurabacteria bacterium]